jgi:hypothetical protein
VKFATDRYKSLHELSPAQTIALDVLDAGGSHTEAAGSSGVDRTTVSRWATKHPAFVAELNRRKRERAEESACQIADITSTALGSVGAAIQAGDASLAMQWLKQFGRDAIRAIAHEPTTPKGLLNNTEENSIRTTIWRMRSTCSITRPQNEPWQS